MNKDERIKQLQEAYNNLLPKAKSWNSGRLLLAWGVGSAVLLTSGFNMFKFFISNL